MRDYIEQICKMPMFHGIQPSELDNMLSCLNSYTRSFQKGEYILLADEPVPCIGVVLTGTVQLVKEDIWGNKAILAITYSGDLFGETFVCSNTSSTSISFWAACDTEVLFLPFERVLHTCGMACVFHHRLIENMMIMVAQKNMQLMEKIDVTSKKTLREKILTYLSLLAQHKGSTYIEVPLGRVELADYLCADRSALTRELSNMKRDGLLDYDKNTFHLLK
ncbi:Crp/Fnr family transcriptional regulator [Enterocloster bolteae]|uniref:Crp/Fnr family transcriptional regulator n=2 Tax=Clostridia TaxID=186801 RepID=UPI002A7F2678|nr:Crp/Fnr family transcriptional regulator [Enterocloster bolteae]